MVVCFDAVILLYVLCPDTVIFEGSEAFRAIIVVAESGDKRAIESKARCGNACVGAVAHCGDYFYKVIGNLCSEWHAKLACAGVDAASGVRLIFLESYKSINDGVADANKI